MLYMIIYYILRLRNAIGKRVAVGDTRYMKPPNEICESKMKIKYDSSLSFDKRSTYIIIVVRLVKWQTAFPEILNFITFITHDIHNI